VPEASGGAARRAARAALRLALLTWPAQRRRRDGGSLVDAFLDDARAAGWAPIRLAGEVFVECAVLSWSGMSMRVSHAVETWGRDIASDVRLAARGLRRSPGFTAAAVTTLALGVGANAAVFELVDRTLLRSTGYAEPDRLFFVWNSIGGSEVRERVAAPDVAVFREEASDVAEFAFVNRVTDGAIERSAGDGAEHVRVAAVSANLFELLGVDAEVGRALGEADGRVSVDSEDASPVVVLSDAVWRRIFGGDRTIVGASVLLNGRAADVVGVLPTDFRLDFPPESGVASAADVWVPFRVPLEQVRRADGRRVDQDSDNTGAVLGRLAPGVTLAGASERMRRVAARLRDRLPEYREADLDVFLRPLQRDATAHARPLLGALVAGVLLVLLVTCLNLSTLLRARAARRAPELAVQVALGAGRARIARRLAVEGIVLGVMGVISALVVARFAAPALQAALPGALSGGPSEAAGLRTFGALAVAGVAVTVSLSLLPTLRAFGSSIGSGDWMRGGRSGVRGRGRSVALQVAASAVLLLGVGLLSRSATALGRVDPGFDAQQALTFSLSLRSPGSYRGPGDRARLMRNIEAAIAELGGVSAVGLTGHLPLSGRHWTQPYGLPGQPPSEWPANRADFRTVSSGYFRAMGVRILEGRGFSPDEDLYEERRVVVVDETLARRVSPSGSAVGEVIGIPLDGSEVAAEIVGVVGHVRHTSLSVEGRETVFVPYRQEASRDVSFVVRTRGEPASLAPMVRTTVRRLDPGLALYDFETLEAYVDSQIAPVRFGVSVLGAFSLLALLAASVGLYGVVALEVTSRTRDIGLRMAVGATRADVLRSVLMFGLRLGTIGLWLGAIAGFALWRLLRSLFYGVEILDPLHWIAVAGAVSLTVVLASLAPALRAAKLDPTTALRAN
jgi:putative ABC transport system permease protein